MDKKGIFFAPDKKFAIDYANKVNKSEGLTHIRVDSIRLAENQINHVQGWKTWEFEHGKEKNNHSDFDAGMILKQLGGNRFIAMTGASNFVKNDKEKLIAFKIGRNANNINYVRIKLNSMDTYDMEFIRIRGDDLKVVSKADGVYNDMLQSVFTEHTGLYTSL